MKEEMMKDASIIEGDADDDSVDTATESYDSEEDSQYSYEDDNDGRPLPMPPLKYARIMGSLPRDNNNSNNTALSVKMTSSCMGRVVVRPSQTLDGKSHDLPSGSKHGELGENAGTEWNDYEEEEADMEREASVVQGYHQGVAPSSCSGADLISAGHGLCPPSRLCTS